MKRLNPSDFDADIKEDSLFEVLLVLVDDILSDGLFAPRRRRPGCRHDTRVLISAEDSVDDDLKQ